MVQNPATVKEFWTWSLQEDDHESIQNLEPGVQSTSDVKMQWCRKCAYGTFLICEKMCILENVLKTPFAEKVTFVKD